MHGIIFQELQQYVETNLGNDAWDALLKGAGMPGRVFMPTQAYPDEDALALVTTASNITGNPAPAILEDFGKYLVPDLYKLFGMLIRTEWKTLDVLENAERSIHTAVKAKDPKAQPPSLSCIRTAPDEVTIDYRSPRKMCGVAVGIAKGLAEHYGESIEVTHDVCMLKGDPNCVIKFKLVPIP
ncbi:MAG: heme NO-binding domain-containing protein [Deltaproteobacteria bacterium]|nr:heme NO-binding domain-containing protein [Deltaproteobacteria bacterium]